MVLETFLMQSLAKRMEKITLVAGFIAAVAWSPDGETLIGLVITACPKTLERDKGLIVRIDLE